MSLESILEFPLEDEESVSPFGVSDEIGRDIFGVDIFFDALEVTPSGDWLTVSGLENLRQAIRRRLIVKPGEFKVRPTYGVGIGLYLKKAMPKSVLDDLRQQIISQLEQEKRLEKVNSVELTKENFGNTKGLRVRVSVTVRNQLVRFKPFNFVQRQ